MEESNFALALEKRKNWMVTYGWVWIVITAILISFSLYHIEIEDPTQVQLTATETANIFTFTADEKIDNLAISESSTLYNETGNNYSFKVVACTFVPASESYLYSISIQKNDILTKTQNLHFKERKNILQLIIEYYIR